MQMAGAAWRLDPASLVARHAGNTVLLVSGELPGKQFYDLVSAELHSTTGAIGVGSLAETISGIPRSLDMTPQSERFHPADHAPGALEHPAMHGLGIR
jgi:hypothetical protein